MNRGQVTIAIMADFCKAFDTLRMGQFGENYIS